MTHLKHNRIVKNVFEVKSCYWLDNCKLKILFIKITREVKQWKNKQTRTHYPTNAT